VLRTGLAQGTVSKHLQLLHSARFVSRRKNGLFVYYELADEDVLPALKWSVVG
jgi:DNA-binding transcriptional ArsR family regulator